MRKYLILTAACLALTMALSACSGSDKNAETSQPSEAATKEIIVELDSQAEPETSSEESTAASSEASEGNGDQSMLEGAQTEALAENTTPETTTAMPVYEVKPMEKTMYAIKPVNVREGYTTGTAVLSSLKAGQEVEVTGMSENGWIQIKFNGGEAYVYKTYLSESKDDVETKAASESKANKGTAAADPAQKATQPASQPSTESAAAPESAPTPVTIPPSPIS